MRARVLELAHGALTAIQAARARLDDLNVYPVADGDTGSNLEQTVRAVVEGLEASASEERVELARAASRAALRAARGNSGVILSQMVHGAAEALAVSDALAPALRAASDAAYAGVRRPVEGTMLTAIRELAEAAEAGADLKAVVARGDACVQRTPELLPALAAAGVVDAGAAGLVEIVRGIAAAAAGDPLPVAAPVTARLPAAVHQELSRYRYCTSFLLEGERLDGPELERALERLGDSVLVVGDGTLLKVHVHVDDPGQAISIGVAQGAIADVEIADMHEQTRAREQRLTAPRAAVAVVAVADGAGNRDCLERLGARVVAGRPSSEELVAAVEATGAEDVIVVPNNRELLGPAEQAAAAAAVRVHVVPTQSFPAGLSAMVAFDPTKTAAANVADMLRAADGVTAGAVALASGGPEADEGANGGGAWLALLDGEPLRRETTFEDAAHAVVERLLAEERGLLTLVAGEGAPPLEQLLAAVAAHHPDVEVTVHDGGQPQYPLLIAAE